MRFFARVAMKQTAAQRGVDWDAETQKILSDPEVRTYASEEILPCHRGVGGVLNMDEDGFSTPAGSREDSQNAV
jgi:hypothetical protein